MKRDPVGLLIPLPATGAAEPKPLGVIARLVADSGNIRYAEARAADMDFRVYALKDAKLSQRGLDALKVLAACHFTTRLPWPGWVQREMAHFALWVENAANVQLLSQQNSESATLGIALTALAFMAGQKLPNVAATGNLAVDPALINDARVVPVGLINRKLRLLEEAVRAQPPTPDRPWHLFLPRQEPVKGPEGQPPALRDVAATHADLIARLTDLGARVHIVDTLREAAGILGITHIVEPPRLVRARRVGAAVLLLLALAGYAQYWLTRPVSLLPADPRDQVPVRMAWRNTARDGFVERPACIVDNLPAYRVGEYLRLSLDASRDGAPASVHDMLVTLSRSGEIKVTPGAGGPRTRITHDVPLLPPAQPGAVMVLAWNGPPPAPDGLYEAAAEAMKKAGTEGERLRLAVNRLADMAPGHVTHFITLLDRDDPQCPE
ncbi:hypothetical protein [Niveispirillum sp.]|uniref:hypothetical protein n=1 Tax=Niveispirillum sp. TaxID=1917217 RepID=UPI001B3DCEDC|nr:hypothetical protein [Niveispirillum sp.]MBP7335887.1 hypothetical protein [Niveispirillum sp.]